MLTRQAAALAALAAITLTTSAAHALEAYGVTANGTLFRFDPDNEAVVTTIGNIGFVPEGIDFRPATGQLYAIDVSPAGAAPSTISLFTLNPATAAPTPVGSPFNSPAPFIPSVTNATAYGFDFNPAVDLIRFVSNVGGNLRINPNTGALFSTDTNLAYAALDSNVGAAPKVSAVAYNNNLAGAVSTVLYGMDPGTDDLVTILPPNGGTLNTVGPFGVTIDFLENMGFDIYTDPTSLADRGLAVGQRTDTSGGAYLLYDVDLFTGGTTGGRLVGGGLDFVGGFTVIPEPASLALLAAGGLLLLRRRKA